jgi:hypothetical protein
MTAIFAFDESEETVPRGTRERVSSVSSFDDRWNKFSMSEELDEAPRFRHFGTWDIAEEDETVSRSGTPPIPIPNANGSPHFKASERRIHRQGSVTVDFEEDFIARQVQQDGALNRKMVPGDFEQVRVLGRGAYGTVLLVRHKENGQLFAQKQLKKASLVVQTKIVGMLPLPSLSNE